ncbi:hypothetical protein [Bradyrhizobium uaiense]|uniref:hypothetical protein n=1 Tax=Bradyrhizobium uaiense TaxID=2594946 RepID=UPI0013D0F295|nr:hypothetical protein [Bradyrhizobium uaiense]
MFVIIRLEEGGAGRQSRSRRVLRYRSHALSSPLQVSFKKAAPAVLRTTVRVARPINCPGGLRGILQDDIADHRHAPATDPIIGNSNGQQSFLFFPVTRDQTFSALWLGPARVPRDSAAGLIAGTAVGQDWGNMAIISTTLDNSNRLCVGDRSRPGDIGCSSYAPRLRRVISA